MNYSEFGWEVAGDGYQWVIAKIVQPSHSVVGDRFSSIGNTSVLVRRNTRSSVGHAPMKRYPALFRTFAALESTEDAILEFSRKFGWLRGTYSVVTLKGEENKGEPYVCGPNRLQR
jgi:hypothetical protein